MKITSLGTFRVEDKGLMILKLKLFAYFHLIALQILDYLGGYVLCFFYFWISNDLKARSIDSILFCQEVPPNFPLEVIYAPNCLQNIFEIGSLKN